MRRTCGDSRCSSNAEAHEVAATAQPMAPVAFHERREAARRERLWLKAQADTSRAIAPGEPETVNGRVVGRL